ncbi:MAG: acetyl-CoA C-acetyltransferase [Solirubrobacteraceae bacterium]|nr:acetyl-CoA C-acetyltransferase [Solirubrobacteraceae bacterium]
MPEAVIVDAVRTPIGRAFKGSLVGVRADELAATPLRALRDRNPDVDFDQTVDVMMGSASGIGEQGYNVGRNATLLAGFDAGVPACTVNRFCASSLQTLRMAFHAIRAGEGEQYVAAGVEAYRARASARRSPTRPSTRCSTAPRARCTTSTSRWG